MEITIHRARIVGPISYQIGTGRRQKIPCGPCIVEGHGAQSADIIWGARGQISVALTFEEIAAAQDHGDLVLLD